MGGKIVPDSEINFGRHPADVSPEEMAEMDRFGEQILPYLHRHMIYWDSIRTNHSITPDSPAHPTQMKETGGRIRAIRKDLGLKRAALAVELKVDPIELAAFEVGWIPPTQLPAGFAEKVSDLLQSRLKTPDEPI